MGSKIASKINAFSLQNRENLDFSRWFEFARTSVFFCTLERTTIKMHLDLDSLPLTNKRKTVNRMSAKEYADILTKYPNMITKEQMYQLCYISKRTALFLLESGLIPSQCSGKQTHKYTIATSDVVAYLIQRESDPEKFTPPIGWYKPDGRMNQVRKASIVPQLSPETIEQMRQLFIDILTLYPELLNVADVVEITGYCSTTVVN